MLELLCLGFVDLVIDSWDLQALELLLAWATKLGSSEIVSPFELGGRQV